MALAIEDKRLIKQGKDVLKDYQGWMKTVQVLKITQVSISSPNYSDMPRAKSNQNNQESKTINQINKIDYYKRRCNLVNEVLSSMRGISVENDVQAQLLYLRYIKGYSVTKTCFEMPNYMNEVEYRDYEVVDLPESTYRRLLNKALHNFAYIFPFRAVA